MASLAGLRRYEEASLQRDRLATFVRAAARTQRLTSITSCREIVAARREDDGRWQVHIVRFGRLAAAGVIPSSADAHQFVAELSACAESVPAAPGPIPAASAQETEIILRWLDLPGVRLVEIDGDWVSPIASATRYLPLVDVNPQRHSLMSSP